MKQRAHDYHTRLVDMLQNLGPDAVALGLHAFPSRDLMRFRVSTPTAVSTLAEWLGLDAPTIERAGTIAWPQATAEEGLLRVIVTGPYADESNSGGTAGPSCGAWGTARVDLMTIDAGLPSGGRR